MKSPVIKIDDEVGKLIGFTSDYFDYGYIWNALPAGLYINALYPLPGKEDEAIEHLLDTIKELKIRARFVAPSPFVVKHLKQYGYLYYKDPAGTPNWVRLSEKGVTALCGQIGISPEDLKKQSEDYVV